MTKTASLSLLFALLITPALLPAADVLVSANAPQLRYTGRFDFSDPKAPRFGWPGCSIEAAFTGKNLGIRLAGQTDWPVYFDASIDGGAPRRLTLSGSTVQTFQFKGLKPRAHALKLLRRSESYGGMDSGREHSVFHGLVLEQGASLKDLPPRPPRRFEVIGDSLSVGYGNEALTRTCQGTVPQFTDAARSYAVLVARRFCGELHSTAISGHGLLHNYGDAKVLSADPVPALWTRVLPGSALPVFDFAAWPVDAVIIYLGTNDFSNVNPPSQAQYEAAYKALIADVRAKYAASQPWIFCLYANYPPVYGAYVRNVVEDEKTARSDAKIAAVDLGQTGNSGCDWHPNVVEHEAMAATVAKAIQVATGWEPGDCGF